MLTFSYRLSFHRYLILRLPFPFLIPSGTALDHQGWHEEASAIHRESLRMHTVVFGLAHPDSLVAQGNLAVSLKNQGKYKEAEGLLHSTLDLQRQVLGNQHPDVGSTMHNLAVIKEEQGKHEEACDLFERTLAIKTQALGSTHPSTLKTAYNLQIVRLIILRELWIMLPLHCYCITWTKLVVGAEPPNTHSTLSVRFVDL